MTQINIFYVSGCVNLAPSIISTLIGIFSEYTFKQLEYLIKTKLYELKKTPSLNLVK